MMTLSWLGWKIFCHSSRLSISSQFTCVDEVSCHVREAHMARNWGILDHQTARNWTPQKVRQRNTLSEMMEEQQMTSLSWEDIQLSWFPKSWANKEFLLIGASSIIDGESTDRVGNSYAAVTHTLRDEVLHRKAQSKKSPCLHIK
jgi:hypothetical protein